MPLFLDVDVPNALEKRGFITAPSVTTAVSTASLLTSEEVAAEDHSSLLARLHSAPIFAPPGPRPLRTGARAPTKMQMMAKQKADKDAKAKAVEEKKLLAITHEKEMKAKQQEKLILMAKAKVHLKLKEAIKASTGVDDEISPSFNMVHSHKKSKGSVGRFMVSPVAQSHQYLSPQRKDTTANKRVSVQSPTHFPSDTVTLSGSLESDSLSDGILTIGSESDDKDKVVEVVEQHVRHGTCGSESCGGF